MDFLKLLSKVTQNFIPVEGLSGTSKWLFIEELWKNLNFNKSIIVITDKKNIEKCISDISFFVGRLTEKDAKCCVFSFPAWEILPFESLSPHPDISGERLSTLKRLADNKGNIIVTSIESLIHRILPKEILKQNSLVLESGDELERSLIADYLVAFGYVPSDLVAHKGEFSIRGDIIDIFPSSYKNPVRIEFFGDEIESLKEFDKVSQKSVKVIQRLEILPARELIIDTKIKDAGLAKIKEYFNGNDLEELLPLIDCFSEGVVFSGMERFMPFFFETVTLFDYMSKGDLIFIDEPKSLKKSYDEFYAVISDEYERSKLRGDFSAKPDMYYQSFEGFKKNLTRFKSVESDVLKTSENNSVHTYEIKPVDIFNHTFSEFTKKLRDWILKKKYIFIISRTDGQASRVHELLEEKDIGSRILPKNEKIDISPFDLNQKENQKIPVSIIIGKLSLGFQIPASNTIFVTENEIFGVRKKIRVKRGAKKDSLLSEIEHVTPGDYVVHIDYGVGLYNGTKFISVHNKEEEFLHIEYADYETLYLPMDSIIKLQKFRGVDDKEPQLAKLGSPVWKKAKDKAKEDSRKVAVELLKLYAKRELADGFEFSKNENWHNEFRDSFEYDETEDQKKAIDDVLADMESNKKMDRLICGDVGFGKTEVAMRAAFKASFDNKQVAVLVPTTLLASQHYQTFLERFKAFPTNIEMLCRFRTKKEQKEIVTKLNNGGIDIVIGTHRLLQKDIEFRNLGLVIIDEEHRFGVTHKEKLKSLRNSVDILTLTATPIPRTLHISLSGIRDLSIIGTPPHDRQAIKTYIRKFNDNVIHDAITREIERSGQVYFIHNRVKSIYKMSDYLRELVPNVKIGVAHGQLGERDLERIVLDFIDKKVDVLLCTTIVESGIDIPSANTIIINKADKFGLAQLYQLRGRVGRDRHRAYAYLLVDENMFISKDARARLEALEQLSELGSGLHLATRDLEIRGSGNILGYKQSGNISSVGFYMYCRLLEENIKELKGEKTLKKVDTTVNLGVKGFISKDYIPVINQRLEMYKRLYMAKDPDFLEDLAYEIIDRYGKMPDPMSNLIKIIGLKICASGLLVKRIERTGMFIHFTFDEETPLDTNKVLEYFKTNKRMKFISVDTISLKLKSDDISNISLEARKGLEALLDLTT